MSEEAHPYSVICALIRQIEAGAKRTEVEDERFKIKVYRVGSLIRVDFEDKQSA